jgi:lysophospholipase L1-like esterase
MSSSPLRIGNADPPVTQKSIPLRRRLLYIAVIYAAFLLLLLVIEGVTRIMLPHLSSLDLFVVTTQQKMQVSNSKQAGIFEGDPLLLWRLKPNLDHVVWDFTVVSTNAQNFRADYPIKPKQPGTFRIVCLGDSVTFGYRVPVVWPDKPTDYNPEWLPFPMLLEKQLRQANLDRHIEVLPMAVPGYTTHQGLAWLRRDIHNLQPDIVIASFGWNDASLSEVPDRQAIRTDEYAVPVRWLIDHSQAFAHLTHWLRSQSKPQQRKPRRAVPRVSESEYLRNFQSIVELAHAHHAGVLVIGAAYRDSTTNPPEAERMTDYRHSLRLEMQAHQVPYLEILELTEAAAPGNEGFFGELIHPSFMGHRLLASEILKLMGRNRMLGDLNVPEFVP